MTAKRKCSGTNAFFASCSSSSTSHVVVELDSIFPQLNTKKVDLRKWIWQDGFPFYLGACKNLDSCSKFYGTCNVILLIIFIVDHPV